MPVNELYLAVLPLMKIPRSPSWASTLWLQHALVQPSGVEQLLTLYPDKEWATQFYPDEVELYIAVFRSNQPSLTGGHVKGYEIVREDGTEGRVIVRVTQHVA